MLEDLRPGRWEALPAARVRGAVGGARRGRRVPHGAGRRAPGGARTPRPAARSPRPRWTRCSTPPPGCSRRSTSRIRRSATTSCGWPRWAPTGTRCCTPRRCGSAGCCASGCSAAPRWCSPRPRWPSAATSTRWPGSGGSRRRPRRPRRPTTRCPIPRPRSGRGWTSARRSRTPAAASSTSPSSLPPPGRDGLPPAYLDEIAGLVEAAGGRTLGLFSSMRAAKQATEALRDRLATPLLCQGDDATMLLVKRFAEDDGDVAVRHAVAVAGRRRARAVAARA